MKSILVFLLLGFLSASCQGANILFFFGVSTYSHRITVWPLVEALADQGHSVTFLQPAENKNPNPKIKEIVPKIHGEGPPDFLEFRFLHGPISSQLIASHLPNLGSMVCESILNDPDIIKWINSSKFDLVVVDALFNDCAFGLAYKWGAQTVIFATSSVFEWWPDTYGFHAESNWISNIHNGMDLPLSFFQRVITTLGHLYFRYLKVGILHSAIEPILREKLNIPDMPKLSEMESNTSLILMNTHFSEEVARSLPPLIVPVGGMHCTDKTAPLSKEIEDFINQSGKDEGFIYVSFGSGAKITSGPKELQYAFFRAFENIKVRFIWKWEGQRPNDMPSNVYTANWVNQQAILSHPKIRAFITHGGLLSMQEALYNSVPMISFPIFAEQDYNAERVHRTKRGIRLEITTVTQQQLEEAINTILTDDTYSKNVKKTSQIFKDRPQKPLDTALWWVEYVLRHKDTSFLRPLSISQTWYQRRLLDVWAFIALVIATIFGITLFVFKKLLSCCFRKSSIAVPNSSSKKIKVKKN